MFPKNSSKPEPDELCVDVYTRTFVCVSLTASSSSTAAAAGSTGGGAIHAGASVSSSPPFSSSSSSSATTVRCCCYACLLSRARVALNNLRVMFVTLIDYRERTARVCTVCILWALLL